MTMKKIRAVLLCLVATTAVISAIASSAAERPTGLLKQRVRPDIPLTAAREEMVSQLIVRPHRQTGEKLARALQLYDASGLVKTVNAGLTVVRPMSDGGHVVKLDKPVTLTQARLIASRLMQDSTVEMAEPDRMLHATATTPSDPGYSSQWHYFAPNGTTNKGGANLPNAWDTTTGSAGITVAVIDTGYRQHADLGTVLQGYDFITSTAISNDGDGRDASALDPGDWVALNECGPGEAASNSSWHGTHVTGTIAALMSNALGVTGIAPNVKIVPVRVLGKCGGFVSDIVDGMRWAAGIAVTGVPANAHPANVLNMSLGASGACSASMQSAVTAVINAGTVIVAATGNDAASSVGQPANCTGVIAVTAHAIDGDNADYSNIGAETTISAPGGGCGRLASGCTVFSSPNGPGVLSLWNGGTTSPAADAYAYATGTSMATPHVTGVVALMLSVNPTLTLTQIKSYLQSSARAHPAGTTCLQAPYIGLCGAGLLDAQAAIATVLANMPPTINLTPASQVVSPSATVALSSVDAPSTGHTITGYSWVQLTGASVGAISNANTANASFVAPATGTYTFRLTVTDELSHASTAVATVRVNSAPILTVTPAKTATAGQPLSFGVSATDIDGDVLTYYATSLPAGSTLSTAGVFSWPSPVAGSYTLTYHASDNDVNSANGTVAITVSAAAPVAASSGGGGGSFDFELLIGFALLAMSLHIRRPHKSPGMSR